MPTLDVGGHSIFFREQGSARPALLLIHGAGGSSLHFQGLLGLLGRHRRAVALDLPGHGASTPFVPAVFPSELIVRYRELTAAFAEKLGLGRFVLVGHSMGGAVALDFALTYPDRLAGLVLVGTGARLKVSPLILDTIRLHFDQVVQLMAQAGFSPASSRARVEAWAAGLVQTTPELFWADMKACSTFDQRTRVGEIICPTTILSGAEDLLIPPSQQDKLSQLIKGSRLVCIPRAGHYMFWERPEYLAEHILDGQ